MIFWSFVMGLSATLLYQADIVVASSHRLLSPPPDICGSVSNQTKQQNTKDLEPFMNSLNQTKMVSYCHFKYDFYLYCCFRPTPHFDNIPHTVNNHSLQKRACQLISLTFPGDHQKIGSSEQFTIFTVPVYCLTRCHQKLINFIFCCRNKQNQKLHE